MHHFHLPLSQVTVAVYVFWKSWTQEESERYLAAAILLFIPGILKCILKPWNLFIQWRVSWTLNSTPHQRNCWLGKVRERREYFHQMRERSFIPTTPSMHNYQVSTLANSAMKLCLRMTLVEISRMETSRDGPLYWLLMNAKGWRRPPSW